jgi:endonuclease-3
MREGAVEAIFEVFQALSPEPKTELHYDTPFKLLVAIVLSAQATDISVNLATPGLFALADTPQKMACLSEDEVRRPIRTIGLYNSKAKNLIALSKMLIERFDGKIPRDRTLLETLPGVGRKTASVWLNTVHQEPHIAVDTHVFRVANRTGLARALTPSKVQETLERAIPERFRLHAHHWLILHGRYVCKARKPECPRCPIARWCEYEDKTK